MKPMTEFIFPIEIYTEDTDFGGVVYHANYIKFMERARTTWAIKLGWRLDHLMQNDCFFVVRNVQVDFLYPARLHDHLEVVTAIQKIGRTSITFQQDIRFADRREQWATKGTIVLVTINRQGKPIELPTEVMQTLNSIEFS